MKEDSVGYFKLDVVGTRDVARKFVRSGTKRSQVEVPFSEIIPAVKSKSGSGAWSVKIEP